MAALEAYSRINCRTIVMFNIVHAKKLGLSQNSALRILRQSLFLIIKPSHNNGVVVFTVGKNFVVF
jgi:hypothetical protein